jgi:hypothetical protein
MKKTSRNTSSSTTPPSISPIACGLLVAVSVAINASGDIIQEWNFTGGSLLSESGTNAGFFGTVPDIDGNNQYNVTRGIGNSGSVLLGTSISAANASSVTLSVTLAGFNFATGNDQSFSARLRSGTTSIGEVSWDAQTAAASGSIDRMRLTGSAVAGVALNATASATPITYGLTLSFTDNTYTYWIGTPTSDNTTWVSRFVNHTGPMALGSVTLDNAQWGIANFGTGNSFNLDQIQISTTPVPEPSTVALTALSVMGLALLRRRS